MLNFYYFAKTNKKKPLERIEQSHPGYEPGTLPLSYNSI